MFDFVYQANRVVVYGDLWFHKPMIESLFLSGFVLHDIPFSVTPIRVLEHAFILCQLIVKSGAVKALHVSEHS